MLLTNLEGDMQLSHQLLHFAIEALWRVCASRMTEVALVGFRAFLSRLVSPERHLWEKFGSIA